MDVLVEPAHGDVLLIAVGAWPATGWRSRSGWPRGLGVTVVDPRWVSPVPAGLVDPGP